MGKRKAEGLKSDGDDQQQQLWCAPPETTDLPLPQWSTGRALRRAHAGPGGGPKKKRVIKLSRKQPKRKSDKESVARGQADRRSRKTRKTRKGRPKAASKELW